jgi:hypothetical protein
MTQALYAHMNNKTIKQTNKQKGQLRQTVGEIPHLNQ